VHALVEKRAPAEGGGAYGVYGGRARVLGLALRHDRGEDVAAEARAVLAGLERQTVPRKDLDLDAFRDFRERHRLRSALIDAYHDALDPIGLDERWGYWTAEEFRRQALLVGMAAKALAGEPLSVPPGLTGSVPALEGIPAVRWPSVLAAALHSEDQRDDFGVTGLGALPTGDSLVDVAGWPGPRAIGRLTRLDMDDPAHRPRLEEAVRTLDAALAADPATVQPALDAFLAELDAHGHGSRYYNMKQARNEGVRVLARRGRPDLAARVLEGAFPLHKQDWACPNRAGILHVIEGRLRAEAGDRAGAEAAFARALEEADTFLAAVDGVSPRRAPAGGRDAR
jgi:tetratricopeptide (TPR) repeat protein